MQIYLVEFVDCDGNSAECRVSAVSPKAAIDEVVLGLACIGVVIGQVTSVWREVRDWGAYV